MLAGAAESLPGIAGIQVELSLVPLYDGARLFPEINQQLYAQGYVLVSTEPVQIDALSSRLTQLDGIYYRAMPR